MRVDVRSARHGTKPLPVAYIKTIEQIKGRVKWIFRQLSVKIILIFVYLEELGLEDWQ